MASIDKTPNGKWRIQIRRRGLYTSKTRHLKTDAQAWAQEVEPKIDRHQSNSKRDPNKLPTPGDLIGAISTTCMKLLIGVWGAWGAFIAQDSK